MKIAALVARILLGLLFVFAGVMKFVPMKAQIPPGLAGQYTTVLMQSHILHVVGALEVIGGLLLVVGRFVPLGLVILGPILVNILLVDILLDSQGLIVGIVCVLLWGLVYWRHREAFAGIFAAKA
jgi:putative oxidoreductase